MPGAIAASYFALYQYENIPQPWLFLLMFLAGALAGGLWGAIPAYFKSRFGTNETLFTLMLNYIAVYIIQFLREGPWMNPANTGFPQIARFDSVARLPKVFGVHIGWIVALILVTLVQVYLTKTKHGYEISVVGESMDTAKYAGMNTKKIVLRSMFFSAHSAELPGCFRFRGQTIRWWKQWRAEWALRLSQWPGWHGSTLPWLWSLRFYSASWKRAAIVSRLSLISPMPLRRC